MIAFSPQGWFGVISEEITFENIAILAQATADYLNEINEGKASVCIGYDTRFLSREYAWTIQRVLTGNGIRVYLNKRPSPSSFLSFSVRLYNADLGIMVTGEGRPARYSGMTFKAHGGRPVTENWMSQLFHYLYRRYPRTSDESRHLLHYVDVAAAYSQWIRTFIQFDRIQKLRPLVVSDSFFGSMGAYAFDILKDCEIACLSIRSKPNPGFMDSVPIPNERNIQPLAKLVKQRQAMIGLFFSGDGSQVGTVDTDGSPVPFGLFSAAAVETWIRGLGPPNHIYTGLSTPQSASTLIKSFKIEESPLSALSFDQNFTEVATSLIWTRQSVIFGPYLPDKDGLFLALLFLQALCHREGKWQQMYKDMAGYTKDRLYEQKMISLERGDWKRKKQMLLGANAELFLDHPITRIEEDGALKLHFQNSWITFCYNAQEENISMVYDSEDTDENKEFLTQITRWLLSLS